MKNCKSTVSVLGCGWLGMPLTMRLLQNFSVKGSVAHPEKLKLFGQGAVEPFVIDLKNINTNIFPFLDTDFIILSLPPQEILFYENLLKYIEQSKVKKVLFISSISVYENKNEIVTENTNLKDCKLAQIEQLFISNKTLETTIIRFGGLVGEKRNPANFYPQGKEIPNPKGVINFIHLQDCIRIIEQVLLQKKWNLIFNACAPTHPLRKDFFTQAALNSGKPAPLFAKELDNLYKIIDSSKLEKILNYVFVYPDLLSNYNILRK